MAMLDCVLDFLHLNAELGTNFRNALGRFRKGNSIAQIGKVCSQYELELFEALYAQHAPIASSRSNHERNNRIGTSNAMFFFFFFVDSLRFENFHGGIKAFRQLLTLWRNEIQSVQKLDGESNLGFNSNAGIAQEEDEGEQESITEKYNDNANALKHAMVLLGSTEMDGKTLFVLLNTWKKMPLILVSFDYMVACKCKITFLSQDLPENSLEGKRECGLLATECSHPDYVEEGCYIEGEHDYELLEGSS